MRAFLVLLLFVAAGVPLSAQSLDWSWTGGPTSIDLRHLHVFGDAVLGVEQGRLHVSTDDGQSWGLVKGAPDSIQTVWAGDGYVWLVREAEVQEVLRAQDPAGPWEALVLEGTVARLVSFGDTLYAAPRGGYVPWDEGAHLYRSIDAGASWETLVVPAPYDARYSEALLMLDDGTLFRSWRREYASTPLYRSDDGGVTWTGTTCHGTSVAQVDTTLFFSSRRRSFGPSGIVEGGLRRSVDGGLTCTTLGTGDYLHVRGGDQLAVGTRDGLFVSDDQGATLKVAALPGVPVGASMATSTGTLLLTTETRRDYCSPDPFAPPCPRYLDAGMFRWAAGTEAPVLMGTPAATPTVAVHYGELYAGGRGLYRLDPGNGWTHVDINRYAQALHVDDEHLVVMGSGRGGYERLHADGTVETAFDAAGGDGVEGLRAVLRTRGEILGAVPVSSGRSPALVRYRANVSPGAARWFTLADGLDLVRALHEDPATGHVYAGCHRDLEDAPPFGDRCPGVLRSETDLDVWEPLVDGLPTVDGLIEAFAFTTEAAGPVLVATRDGVYTLNGTTWVPHGLAAMTVFDLVTHPIAGTFAATERGVYRWLPHAAAWQQVGLEERAVYDLFVSDTFTEGEMVLAVATDRGVYTSAPLVPIDVEDQVAPAGAFATAAYPNPFAETLAVEVVLPAAAEVSATVYDVLGRVAAEVPVQTRAAGTHRLPVATERLATGVYLVRVSVEGQPGRVVTVTRVR